SLHFLLRLPQLWFNFCNVTSYLGDFRALLESGFTESEFTNDAANRCSNLLSDDRVLVCDQRARVRPCLDRVPLWRSDRSHAGTGIAESDSPHEAVRRVLSAARSGRQPHTVARLGEAHTCGPAEFSKSRDGRHSHLCSGSNKQLHRGPGRAL